MADTGERKNPVRKAKIKKPAAVEAKKPVRRKRKSVSHNPEKRAEMEAFLEVAKKCYGPHGSDPQDGGYFELDSETAMVCKGIAAQKDRFALIRITQGKGSRRMHGP